MTQDTFRFTLSSWSSVAHLESWLIVKLLKAKAVGVFTYFSKN